MTKARGNLWRGGEWQKKLSMTKYFGWSRHGNSLCAGAKSREKNIEMP